jgi:hypothetical protein
VSVRSASEWRAFWRDRGERELALLLRDEWGGLGEAPLADYRAQGTRVATLLGSRAPERALAAELRRMRAEAGAGADDARDAAAAATIAGWFRHETG